MKHATMIFALLLLTACGYEPAAPRAPAMPDAVDVQCATIDDCGEGEICRLGQCELHHCTQDMCDALVPGMTCRWLGAGTDPRCCTGAGHVAAEGDTCCDVREHPDCAELEPR